MTKTVTKAGMEEIHPLRRFRKQQQPPLSQKGLADMLEKDRVTVHRWETGKRLPEKNDLELITKTTGIPAREIRPDLAELLDEAAQ